MPNTYNWLQEIPFWEQSALGRESKVFSLEDFLTRSNRPGDQEWYVHFRHWCLARRAGSLEFYDARSLGPIHGVEMLVVTRYRMSQTMN